MSIGLAQRLVDLGLGDSSKLSKAEDRFAKASQEDDPEKAIEEYGKAWELSQEVVNGKRLWISEFGDSPDPFSPVITSSSIDNVFNVLVDANDDDSGGRELVLEVVVFIQDPDGNLVRTLTSTHDVPLPPSPNDDDGDGDDDDSDVIVQVATTTLWDGRDESDELVPGGSYSYLSLGNLNKVRVPDGDDEESSDDDNGGSGSDNDSESSDDGTGHDKDSKSRSEDSGSRSSDDESGSRNSDDDRGRRHFGTSFPVAGSIVLVLDTTPPTIVAVVDPEPNASGWHNSVPVTVRFDCTDDGSGVDTVTPPRTLDTEILSLDLVGTCTDLAGNSASVVVEIRIDTTAPEVVAVVDPAPNANGWNNAVPVTVSFDCTDSLSGVDTVTAPRTLDTEILSLSLTGTCTDLAGNSASVSVEVKIDLTRPTVVDISPTDGSFFNDPRQTLSARVVDAGGSGIDPDIPVQVNGQPVTPVVTLIDPNTAVVEFTPSIDFTPGAVTFEGQPIDFSGTEASWIATSTFDATPPVVSIDISPPDPSQATKTITATFDDAVSGVDLSSRKVSIEGVDRTLDGTFSANTWTLVETFGEGSFDVEAEALDLAGNLGQASESFDVVLLVVQGSIEGLVLDANNGQPIRGLLVRVDGTDNQTRSNAGGFYRLDDVAPGPQTLVFGEIPEDFHQSDSPFAYAMNFKRPTLSPHVQPNQTFEFRPTYLPRDDNPLFHTPFGPSENIVFPVDIGGNLFAQITTTEEIVLDSPNFPGVTTTIPAGVTVNLPDPRFNAGAVMSVDIIPSPLPEGIFTAGVFGFGPEGTFFTDPSNPLPTEPCSAFSEDPLCLRMAMTFPNLDGLPPGTVSDIYAPNFLLGEFVVIGRGVVSNDGTIVNSIGGVLRVLDWHFWAPPPPPPEFTELFGDIVDQNAQPVTATITVVDTGQTFGASGTFSSIRRIPSQGECTTITVSAIRAQQAYWGIFHECDVPVGRPPGELGLTDYGTIVLFFVDMLPPQVEILAPPDGTFFDPGETSSTTVRAIDNVGVVSIDYLFGPPDLIDGPNSGIGIFSPPARVATFGPRPFTVDANVQGPRILTESACARDEQGLEGCDFHDYLIRGGPPDPNDTTPPRVTILTPRNTWPLTPDTQGSSRTVTIRCEDDESGCKHMGMFIRGSGANPGSVVSFFTGFANPRPVAEASKNYTVSLLATPGRTIRITAFGIDDAGNRGDATPVKTVVVGSRNRQPAIIPVCGTDLGLGDNDSREVFLPDGSLFPFYGGDHSSFFVNSNGNITFGAGDPLTLDPTRDDFLGPEPRIAPFFRDLNPTVCVDFLPDAGAPERVVVTWINGPDFPQSLNDVVQAHLFTNLSAVPGRVDFIYPGTQGQDPFVGITPGGPPQVPFLPVNLSSQSSFVTPPSLAVLEEFSVGNVFDLESGFVQFTPRSNPTSYLVEVTLARTTVIGRVLEPDGVTPAAGSDVSLQVLGDFTTTALDGTFVILNVPVVLPIVAVAVGQVNGLPFSGESDSTPPEADGVTDLGTIVTSIIITDPTIIGPADTSFDNQSIIIDGAPVVIDGSHPFVDLTLRNGAVVTHSEATTTTESAMELQIAGTLNIDATSSIDVSGAGYLGAFSGGNGSSNGRTLGNVSGSTRRNGGSHAGLGGAGTAPATPNAAYGDFQDPSDPGSGGGSDQGVGGDGGGTLRIDAQTVILDGTIRANGTNGVSGCCAGGGSGGSIRLDVGTLSGAGSISANGGASSSSTNSGGGGGGRVALRYDDATGFDLSLVEARGGTGLNDGGAGTIFLKDNAQPLGLLRVLGGGSDTPLLSDVTLDTFEITDATVVGGPIASVTLEMESSTLITQVWMGMSLSVLAGSNIRAPETTTTTESSLVIDGDTIEIDSTSSIDVSGAGYLGAHSGGNGSSNGRTLGNASRLRIKGVSDRPYRTGP